MVGGDIIMMTLKECFQYARYLDNLKMEICNSYLYDNNFLMDVTETHKRSKALHNDEPDIVVNKREDKYPNIDVQTIVSLLNSIIDEYARLQDIITEAKAGTGFDALVATNTRWRDALSVYQYMLREKPYTKTTIGSDFMINAEGNQTPYKYEIEVNGKIAFDKDTIRNMVKMLHQQVEETSSKIDELQLRKVDFEPKYSTCDTLDDIVENYKLIK